jgi:isocitrate/isopropylmalate dehydrogenase
MFEPIHGSAFDLVGRGTANPVATFWTIAEMLAWLGEDDASKILLECIQNACEKGIVTRDLGGNSSTVDVLFAVAEEIKALRAR